MFTVLRKRGRAWADVAGCVLWLRASSLSLNDGDSVQTWNDASGNGFHVTQATADRRPLYKTNIVNGKPAVRFDGVDDYLQNTAFSATFPNGALTIFIVFSEASAPAHHGILSFNKQGAGHDYESQNGFAITQGISTVHRYGADNCEFAVSPALGIGTFYIARFIKSGGNAAIHIDGAAATGTDTYSEDHDIAPDRVVVSYRALDVAYEDQYGQNDIAEIRVYEGALGSADILTIETKLSNEYGIELDS